MSWRLKLAIILAGALIIAGTWLVLGPQAVLRDKVGPLDFVGFFLALALGLWWMLRMRRTGR
jgi:threonine/homoserine efflux transporter RhtA